MRDDHAAQHLKIALQHFGLAKAYADRAAADSFTTDIPDGRPTAYANAAIYADRIAFLRDCTRNLIDPCDGLPSTRDAAIRFASSSPHQLFPRRSIPGD